MKEVELFSDGACSGNPGPGGWGIVVIADGVAKQLSGGEEMTTNNRMELLAVINGLESLKEPCKVTITTDSKYVCDAFLKDWLSTWEKNGWKTAGKKPVKNKELWEKLLELSHKHELLWTWIKGHAGHPENERCDKLAVEARKKIAQ